mgnify:CR=1 FL=1
MKASPTTNTTHPSGTGLEGLLCEIEAAHERITSLVAVLDEQIEGIRMAQCDMARINTLTWAIEQQAEVLLLAARVEMRGAA